MRCLQNKEDEWKWNPIFSTGLVSLIHFSRGPTPCQDHTSKGTGESVFPGSRADVLHFLCCLCAASSKLVKLGGGPRRTAVQLPPEPSPRPLDKPVEAWALKEQAPPTAWLRTGDDPPLSGQAHVPYVLQSHVAPVSYTHLTLPTTGSLCRSRWSPYH